MSRISEKVAYLDGLMEGLSIQDDKYAKVFSAIVDALDLIAEEMADHEDTLADLDDSVEEIFENLDEYDDFLYGDEEDDDEDEEFDDDDFFEIVCPNCGETIYFDQDMLDRPDGLICPNCNEPIELHIPDAKPED
jgi:hypothetical protein